MLKIAALEKLTHELSRFPGIGPKTAQRLAYFALRAPQNFTEELAAALLRVRDEVHECPRCFNYTDLSLCRFCADSSRLDQVICVVEDPSALMRIDSTGVFRGRFHVLQGAMSPLDGIGPQELKIEPLLARVEAGLRGEGPRIEEIIFALDSDLEGDTTVLYLTGRLQGKNLRMTRIAHGVPIGSDIDFVDTRTMGRALESRVEI